VLAGAAEMERNLVGERTRAALSVKRARGQRISRTPYGYDLAPDGATLVENPAEQTIIGEILGMRARGMSYPRIARALTGRGIPTKRGNSHWRHETVAGLVKRHGNNGASRP
jgi:DNA invertase Pin-like site-specific DNA recombinase